MKPAIALALVLALMALAQTMDYYYEVEVPNATPSELLSGQDGLTVQH